MMSEVVSEIGRAIQALNLERRVTRVGAIDAAAIARDVRERFVRGSPQSWWWESFRESSESRHVPDGRGFELIPTIVPSPTERCWLLVDVEGPGRVSVFDASPNDISLLVGESFGFEYYLVAKDVSWLLCENHHDRLIGCGELVERALRSMPRPRFA